MHLELLYCPYGMSNGFSNPFSSDTSSLTSLEKVLKSGGGNVNGSVENGNFVGKKKREVIIRGVLMVTVISAEDLPPADVLGKADPYVVVILKKTESRNKTRVTLNCHALRGFF